MITNQKPQRLEKARAIAHWRELPTDAPIPWEPVPYKHEGSTYGQCGIRLTGSRAFIDAVLGRIRDTLEHENGQTRLQLSYQQSTDRDTGHPVDSWNCYIQVHYRGHDARMINAMFGLGAPACG